MAENPTISVATAKSFIKDVFIKVGVPEPDADICADILIASDSRGIESHGISRLKMYVDRIRNGSQQAVSKIDVIRDGPTTAVWDGNHGMGHVIGFHAMNAAITKAKKYGMGSVAVRNSTHYGIAGYYPMMAVEQGLIGMSVTNTRPSVAPTFGGQPLLGTNPIAIGFPTDEAFPYIFDAATSIIQRGKVEISARKGKQLPDGWVIDSQGNPSNDPAIILKALTEDTNSLLPLGGMGEPFGGHKGYGLSTVVEILSSSLQTGAFLHQLTGFNASGEKQPFMIGHFFMAMDVEGFLPLDEFKHNIGSLLRELRGSSKTTGAERIYTAGEKEYEYTQHAALNGLEILPGIQTEFKQLQSELQLDHYKFPF